MTFILYIRVQSELKIELIELHRRLFHIFYNQNWLLDYSYSNTLRTESLFRTSENQSSVSAGEKALGVLRSNYMCELIKPKIRRTDNYLRSEF